MRNRLAIAVGIVMLTSMASGQDTQSYPISLDPSNVYEMNKLDVKLNGLHIESDSVLLVPISCAKGVTGAVVIGNGRFQYTPKEGKAVEGQFRSLMLRFNPFEWEELVTLDKATKITDSGAVELSRQLLRSMFGRCWHRGPDALIPPEGTLAADLFSKEHGELLISTDDAKATIYNFTAKQMISEK